MPVIHSFELWLHWKQGDDLAQLIEDAKGDLPDAFRAWADLFGKRRGACEEIARALIDTDITVSADTHHIALEPHTETDDEVLQALVEKGIIFDRVEDVDDDEIDDDVPDGTGTSA